MAGEPVSIVEAARQLGRSPSAVRRWIVKGAPTASLGKVGRGNGSLVSVDALQRWRMGGVGANDAEVVQCLAIALWDVFKRDAGLGDPAHRTLGIREYQAALYLAHVFERCARSLIGTVPDPLPAEIQTLMAVGQEIAHK